MTWAGPGYPLLASVLAVEFESTKIVNVFTTYDEEVRIDEHNRRREEKNSELRCELHMYGAIEDEYESTGLHGWGERIRTPRRRFA
jgi:hypothetical protein